MIKAKDLGKTVSTSEGALIILKGINLEIKKSETSLSLVLRDRVKLLC